MGGTFCKSHSCYSTPEDVLIRLALPNHNFYILQKGVKIPGGTEKNMLGKTVWVIPVSGKGKMIRETGFAQELGYVWWVMWEDWKSSECLKGIIFWIKVAN